MTKKFILLNFEFIFLPLLTRAVCSVQCAVFVCLRDRRQRVQFLMKDFCWCMCQVSSLYSIYQIILLQLHSIHYLLVHYQAHNEFKNNNDVFLISS